MVMISSIYNKTSKQSKSLQIFRYVRIYFVLSNLHKGTLQADDWEPVRYDNLFLGQQIRLFVDDKINNVFVLINKQRYINIS